MISSLVQYYDASAISSFTTSKSVGSGKAVSIAADGSVQTGAGTSIYKNIVDVTLSCPDYLSMDSVFGNTYILAYAEEITKKATLQVVTVASSTPNKGDVADTKETDYTIVDLVTLDADKGIFVGITQDQDENVDTGFVVAGKVDAQTHQVAPLVASAAYGGQYSLSPVITRLSSATFAIGYYDGNPNEIRTRYGNIPTWPLTKPPGHFIQSLLNASLVVYLSLLLCRQGQPRNLGGDPVRCWRAFGGPHLFLRLHTGGDD